MPILFNSFFCCCLGERKSSRSSRKFWMRTQIWKTLLINTQKTYNLGSFDSVFLLEVELL